jgi:ribonuclease J
MSSADRLIYLPLGGAGEIGMNCYVYGYGPRDAERLIVVDLGVTFPDMDSAPGVDLILPDIAWLEERRDRIEAIFITHAHEDHVGAVGHLWPRLKAPVYARNFTATIARGKLDEAGLPDDMLTVVQPWPEMVTAGPFRVGFVPVSHSIPETSSLVIDTPAGRVLHTGDFKLDPSPIVGEPWNPDVFAEIGRAGVKALVCDSTNVFSPEAGRSESSIGLAIEELVHGHDGMVVATTFASNVARVKTLAEAGRRAGRSVCLLGRAMRRMIEAAVESGVLTNFPATVPPEDAADIPGENLMLIVTGSQGERRAASAQLSKGRYLGMEMKEGDLFLFSSKTIPGNERGVIRIMNAFSEQGVDVVDDSNGRYHVSGHANRPDLQMVHKLVKPQTVIPMHGEHRHLRAHVKLAEASGIAGVVAPNGTMVELQGNAPRITDFIETGRTYFDGTAYVGALDGIIRDRLRMAMNGLVVVTLIIDEDGEVLGDPWCELRGLAETGRSNAPVIDILEEDLSQFLGRAERKTLSDDDKLEEALKRIVRQTCQNEIGKKPEVMIVVSRLA